MFIRTAAVYISLILSVLVTLLLIQEYIPSNLHIIINSNLSIFKYKLLNIYDKLFNIEKEYEISVEFSTKESNNTKISRLIEYLPLQNNEYINYYENDNEENDICLIDHSKPTIQFTIKEKNLSLKKRILKERKENNIAKDKFFNKYMDLKIHGTDKYKTPPMERKMDGEKEYVEMNLKGKLRYVGKYLNLIELSIIIIILKKIHSFKYIFYNNNNYNNNIIINNSYFNIKFSVLKQIFIIFLTIFIVIFSYNFYLIYFERNNFFFFFFFFFKKNFIINFFNKFIKFFFFLF